MRHRAYLLIEVAFTMGLLATVIVAASFALNGAQRNQSMQWEELCASELAASLLERELARDVRSPTPTGGIALELPDAVRLSTMSATLSVEAVPGAFDLVDIRVRVSWIVAIGGLTGQQLHVERVLRRRISR